MANTPQSQAPRASSVIFDASDAQALCQRFTIAQLRDERHKCEVEAAVCRVYGDELGLSLFEGLQTAYEIAITHKLKAQPKPKVGQGRIDIATLKSLTDIVTVVGQYTRLRKSGKRYTGLCPLHADKNTPSLVIYTDQQRWHCFGCNQGGDVIAFVMAVEHLDFKQAAARLGSD